MAEVDGRGTWWRREGIWPAGIVLALCLAMWPILSGSRALFFRDVGNLFIPFRSSTAHILNQGGLPFWNPYFNCGEPLWANPNYFLFVPTSWLYFLHPSTWTFQLHFFLALLAAALGAFYLFRSHVRRDESAFLGALAYSFNGLAISCLNFTTLSVYLSLLPWFCIAMRRLVRGRGAVGILPAACVVALAVMAMDPFCFFGMILSGVLYGFWWMRRSGGTPSRVLRRAICAGLLSVLLAGIQWVPTFQLYRDSSRASGMEDPLYSLHTADFLSWVSAQPFGSYMERSNWRNPLRGGDGLPFLYSLYMGPFLIFLVAAGWRTLPWKTALAALAATLLLVWVATGTGGGLYPLLRRVPLIGMGRYAVKWLLPLLPLFVGLAARGLDRMLENTPPPRRFWLLPLVTTAALLLAAPLWLAWRAGAVEALGPGYVVRTMIGTAWESLGISLGVGLLSLMAVGWALFGTSSWRIRFAVISAAFLAGLYPSGGLLFTVSSGTLTQPPSWRAFLPAGDSFRIAGDFPPHAEMARTAEELYLIYRDDALNFAFANQGIPGGLLYAVDQLSPPGVSSYFTLQQWTGQPDPYRIRFWRMQGVGWVATARPLPAPAVLCHQGQNRMGRPLFLYRIPDPVPLLHSPETVIAAPSGTAQDCLQPFFVPGRMCLVPPEKITKLQDIRPAAIRRQLCLPDGVDCSVEAPTQGLVVYSQTFYRGWHAWVDGRETELIQANGLFMGCKVGPGTHSLRVRFIPPGFFAGLWLSGAGLLAGLVLCGLSLRQARRDRLSASSSS